ncbi:adenylyltransferase/cytidyltransferase family protein [Halorussus sp. MSC15.2]|uniref:adenylyltransferase/cytidyltransferase family protein n=1 Tax=Halorussus sp. MSC15.2 TaxID=2283638 RepID=UPI0013D731D1|nr:adenylyltransferase/cytidyltransferase family protein [Halorussus sp. MSC15.2]NEU56777.1 FAD synthase [Halorussus sp. MSC15.2]
MTHVIAQGTFDLLHPGHVHYLRDAAAFGDRLTVIVARRENVTHKDPPILPNRQRRDVVAAIDVVDDARVGHPEDIFAPIEELDPDVIALGHDQHHDETAISDELARRGIDCEVRRASPRDPEYEGELLSTGRIIDRILAERGDR